MMFSFFFKYDFKIVLYRNVQTTLICKGIQTKIWICCFCLMYQFFTPSLQRKRSEKQPKPFQDIYKASLKSTTHSEQQIPISQVSDKKLYYFIVQDGEKNTQFINSFLDKMVLRMIVIKNLKTIMLDCISSIRIVLISLLAPNKSKKT